MGRELGHDAHARQSHQDRIILRLFAQGILGLSDKIVGKRKLGKTDPK